MSSWLLDYTGQIRLTVPAGEADRLCAGSFFKLSLRRYFSGREEDTLVGKSSLTYLDFKRIIQLCTRECEKRGIPLQVSHALGQYIDSRENFLDQRRKLGIEIQNQDPSWRGRFRHTRPWWMGPWSAPCGSGKCGTPQDAASHGRIRGSTPLQTVFIFSIFQTGSEFYSGLFLC